MSFGVFTDKKHHPSEVEVVEAIGPLHPIWQELVCFVRAKYPVQEDFKFMYGKNYGWALRFRIKTQLLVNLYPVKGCFTAQVNLSPEAVEKALAMNLGQNAQQAIARAHPYPEGRWVFTPVESAKDAQDIQSLLALRVEAKRLVK
jgi:hypothetical protein